MTKYTLSAKRAEPRGFNMECEFKGSDKSSFVVLVSAAGFHGMYGMYEKDGSTMAQEKTKALAYVVKELASDIADGDAKKYTFDFKF